MPYLNEFKRYFLVGTEGSGHHLFITASVLERDRKIEGWADRPYETNNFDRISIMDTDTKEAIISNSIPWGTNPRKPNLMNYLHWCQSNKQDRMIYIYRDPVLCAESISERFDWTIPHSAHRVLDGLIYISAVLRHQKETYSEMPLVFEYNDICENPEKFEFWTGIKLFPHKIQKSTRQSTNNRLKDYFFQSYELYSFIEKCVIKL